MNSLTLCNTLQTQLSTHGNIDVSQLEDTSYTTVFDLLGIPYTIPISGSDWKQNGNEVSFDGIITVESIVLGLPLGNTIGICFSPLQNNPDAFSLTIKLGLSNSWRFGTSFRLLRTNIFDSIVLFSSPEEVSQLIVTASADVVAEPENNPPLVFDGYIDQNSSLLTLLAFFIGENQSRRVTGTIQYVASTGAVDMNLALVTTVVPAIFGSGSPDLTFTLSLFSGINTQLNLYEGGVLFETDIIFGTSTVALKALYYNSIIGAIRLSVSEIDLNLADALNSIPVYFGSNCKIISSIPDALAINSLRISGIAFTLNIFSLEIQYAWLGLSALEGIEWNIWPDYILLSNLNFSFALFNPFSSAIDYSFTFSGLTTFGGENGLPMLVSASLPGFRLQASLSGEPYSLQSFFQYFFEDTKGLPDNLYITKINFQAFPAKSKYSIELEIFGDWYIPFGTNNTINVHDIFISLLYDEDGPQGDLRAKFSIATNTFIVELDFTEENQILRGQWILTSNPLDYEDIAIALGMYGLPDIPPGLDLNLTEASFELETAGPSISFELTSANYGSAALIAGKDADGNWGFVFGMIAGLDLSVNLTDIDVVGNFVPEGMDVIAVDNLRFVGATSAIPLYTPTPELLNVLGTEVNSGLVLSIDLNIGTLFSETFSVRFGGLDDGTATDTPPETEESGDENPPAENNSVQLDTTTTPTIPAALPGPTTAWINVQRSFGPVHIARIGFRITEENALGMILDAGVNLAGLSIGLSGLEADIPIAAPFWPSFSLAGLEVGYIAPGITIAGALVKAYGVTPTMYTGELILQAGSFGASAFGSYTTVNNEPSLFAFLALNIPIGGPPFCVVTGLSLGFGYNRRLILPTIETVQSYPLVQAAMGITDPQQTINALNQYIVPADNQYWLAAGIRFTSFEMLNAYALLTASFGTQVELALMGEALLTLPIAVPGEEELILAQADMVLLASITPSLGQIAISAQLTSRSYILDKNAQITGGFAFYFWYGKSKHKGDFVVTLGGYNPYFAAPSYYPTVPQLGLNWKISNLISIKGGLYCALTPSVIMAGGNLSASYASGDVKAWFNANADFLIRFKPFYFESTIGVSVGASYKLDLLFTSKTISVTVGASLKLWGPPFAGTATVDLKVMSFTIAFGAAKQTTTSSISWNEFRNSFLPPEPGTQNSVSLSNTVPVTADTQSLIQFNAERGMISSATSDQLGDYGLTLPAGSTSWRMNPGKSAIIISSAIPIKNLTLTPWQHNNLDTSSLNTNFGIGPMSLVSDEVNTTLDVKIFYQNANDLANFWSVELITENIPAGLWKNTTNSMKGDALVKNVLTGIRLKPVPTRPDVMAPLPMNQLLYSGTKPERNFSWSPTVCPAIDYFSSAISVLQTTIEDPSIAGKRSDILSVLAAQGLTVYTEDEIQVTGYAAEAPDILYSAPRNCYLGEVSTGPTLVSIAIP